MTDTLDVTLQIRAKHADMHAAAKAFGGQTALAKHIGVSVNDMCSWCNLRSYPHVTPTKDQAWVDNIEAKLFEITQKTLDELFPQSMRSRDFLDVPKTAEVTQRVAVNMLPGVVERLTLPSPADAAEQKETREKVLEAIEGTLKGRERDILKLRWGIGGDGHKYTLSEVGHIYKIGSERVRQIEMRALRELSQPSAGLSVLDPGGPSLRYGQSPHD